MINASQNRKGLMGLSRAVRRVFNHYLLLAIMSVGCLVTVSVEASQLATQLNGVGKVLIVRHALAPGTGDPSTFDITNCATQRNLDSTGRQQSLAMGEWLRSNGVKNARVFSSQWCRCKETAEGLKFGEVTPLPALNSFYQRWHQEAEKMEALRSFLARQTPDETLTILVTHQVTISALTSIFPRSGTGVMLTLDGQGGFNVGQVVNFGQ